MAEVRGSAAILQVISAERDALREELRLLDDINKRVRGALSGAQEPKAENGSGRKDRKKSQGRIRKTPAGAARRERAIHKFLLEHGPSQAGEIHRAVPGAGDKAQLSALRRLIDKGMVRKSGPRQRPSYEALEVARGAEPQDEPQSSTLGGRILTLIEENDGASIEELVAHTGADEDEVRVECRRLVGESEVKLERSGDRVGYVLAVQAGA
jgi:hypothetical protein